MIFWSFLCYIFSVNCAGPAAEQKLFELGNEYRKKKNLPPLKKNSKLLMAAQNQAQYCANNKVCSHYQDNPENAQLRSRIDKTGYQWTTIAENAAQNNGPDAQGALDQWIKSPGHNANLLSDNKEVAYSSASSSDGMMYWIGVYASGSDDENEEEEEDKNDSENGENQDEQNKQEGKKDSENGPNPDKQNKQPGQKDMKDSQNKGAQNKRGNEKGNNQPEINKSNPNYDRNRKDLPQNRKNITPQYRSENMGQNRMKTPTQKDKMNNSQDYSPRGENSDPYSRRDFFNPYWDRNPRNHRRFHPHHHHRHHHRHHPRIRSMHHHGPRNRFPYHLYRSYD